MREFSLIELEEFLLITPREFSLIEPEEFLLIAPEPKSVTAKNIFRHFTLFNYFCKKVSPYFF